MLVNGVSVGIGNWILNEGHLLLNPVDIPTLQTPGIKDITIIANEYSVVSVQQYVAVGEFSEANSSVKPNAGLVPGPGKGFSMILTAKDRYDNLIKGYQFKLDIIINNNNPLNGEWVNYYNNRHTVSITADKLNLPSLTDGSGATYPSFQWAQSGDRGDSTQIVWRDQDGNLIFTPTTVTY